MDISHFPHPPPLHLLTLFLLPGVLLPTPPSDQQLCSQTPGSVACPDLYMKQLQAVAAAKVLRQICCPSSTACPLCDLGYLKA